VGKGQRERKEGRKDPAGRKKCEKHWPDIALTNMCV
jgi:hypothetical protein